MRNKTCTLLALSLFSLSVLAFTPPPSAVETVKVNLADWQSSVEATGILIAKQGTMLKSEVAGRVTHIHFKSGDSVKKGALLLQLNDDILSAKLQLSQANLKLAQQQYQRSANLLKKKAMSQAAADDALAQMKVASAQVATAQAELAQSSIHAPFTGRLGLRKVNLGDYLSAGTEIASLQTITPIYIDFKLPVMYLTKLTKGQKVIISSPAYAPRTFEAVVIAYESQVNSTSQSLTVRAEIHSGEDILFPGTFMHAHLFIGSPQKVLMVPETSMMYSTEGPYVYRVINGKAIKTRVTTAAHTNNKIIIKEGLQAGETIVSAGGMKLFNNAPVIDMSKTPVTTQQEGA